MRPPLEKGGFHKASRGSGAQGRRESHSRGSTFWATTPQAVSSRLTGVPSEPLGPQYIRRHMTPSSENREGDQREHGHGPSVRAWRLGACPPSPLPPPVSPATLPHRHRATSRLLDVAAHIEPCYRPGRFPWVPWFKPTHSSTRPLQGLCPVRVARTARVTCPRSHRLSASGRWEC